jgi:hypothetical protein
MPGASHDGHASRRLSLPSWRRSKAKKHGLPLWNSKSLNCGWPLRSTHTISPSNIAFRTRGKDFEIERPSSAGCECMTVARNKLTLTVFETCKCAEAIVFKFEKPIRMVESVIARLQRLGKEIMVHVKTVPATKTKIGRRGDKSGLEKRRT